MNRELSDRVRRLERTSRLLLAIAAGLGLALVLGSAPENAAPASIRAQRIELVDPDGAVLAALGTDGEGATGLFIHDPKGQLRLSLAHDADQSALFIRDADGTVRIGVAQFAHGGAGVALHGPDSKGAAVLYFKESGSLSFYDHDGNTTMRVPPEN